MYNKIGKNLINKVFSIHGKKDGYVNINVLEGLKNQIKLTIPKITNNEIHRDLKKARDYLSSKIKKTRRLKKDELENNNGPTLTLSSIRKDVLNKSGKPENIDILKQKRENLKKIKKFIPKNKKEEYTSTLRKLRNKIHSHSTRYKDKKRELYHTKKKQKQNNNMNNKTNDNNNMNNKTNAIGMLIELEYLKNNPNINKIPSPGRYNLTKNNLTKL